MVYIHILPANTEYNDDLIYDYAELEQQQTESNILTLGCTSPAGNNSHYRLSTSWAYTRVSPGPDKLLSAILQNIVVPLKA